MPENAPSATVSPQGRRVLVAIVTGHAGERIQAWRECHDPREAARIPPHTTLCYWATEFDLDLLDHQVRHAFPRAISLGLGPVQEFEGDQGTFYVPLRETAALDEARHRLYDRAHLDMGDLREWPWHITCVRDSNGRDKDSLRVNAALLDPGPGWTLDTVACLELSGERYEPVREWRLPQVSSADLVFLLDIDNTLIDHDELKREVTRWVECHAPTAGPGAFWAEYERVRDELGIVDFLESATRFGTTARSGAGETLRAFLWDFPFERLLLPGTLEGCRHLAGLGRLAVLCDGEPRFQRRKLERIGLLQSLDEVFVFDHKELSLGEVERRFPSAGFVMFDDKPRILAAMKSHFGDRLQAVHVRHGHYAASNAGFVEGLAVASLGEANQLFPR